MYKKYLAIFALVAAIVCSVLTDDCSSCKKKKGNHLSELKIEA